VLGPGVGDVVAVGNAFRRSDKHWTAGLQRLIHVLGHRDALVLQRTHEFGVRFALGATRGDIVWTVAGGAFALVGSGVVIGIAVATALAQIMKAALDFAGRPDVLTYAAVAAALLVVAGVAAVAPARRALRVDPMQTLRSN